MVLNPMDTLSLIANIVAIVDFSSKLVSKGCHIFHSAQGALPENLELEALTSDLAELNVRLRHHVRLGCLTKEEQSLEDMADGCQEIANELLGRLMRLKVRPDIRNRKWKSFRQALKTVWNKKELDTMSAKLSSYRDQLQFHILLSLKENNDLIGFQQSDRFDRLDDATKGLLHSILENKAVFSNEFKDQTMAIDRLHVDTRSHVTSEADKAVKEIIDAIRTSNLADGDTRVQIASGAGKGAIDDEYLIESAILESLRFPTMYERYDGIEDAHAQTFDWIFQDSDAQGMSWDNFARWLGRGEGIYWISGKAGSGKSTLMRYINRDPRTMALLRKWSSFSGDPLSAAFFFWISGTADQASQIGLLRSLLYELLSSRRHMIKSVLPELWSDVQRSWSAFHEARQHRWTLARITRAFRSTCLQDTGHIFLLVDGLDECQGDPTETLQLFRSLVSPTVKICVSSRPWQVFEDEFRNAPKLRLQDLTSRDIKYYVDDRLLRNEKMKELCALQPAEAPKLVEEIVAKADGVFLWVKLVVRSLLDGMINGDRVSYLRKRLKAIPTELEQLYQYMLTKIDGIYLDEGFKIFASVKLDFETQLRKGICALTLSFAIEEDENFAVSAPVKLLTESEVIQRVIWVGKRLRVCCAGLLEISNSSSISASLHGWSVESAQFFEFGNREIQYIHRTARDFLDIYKPPRRSLEIYRKAKFIAPVLLLRSDVLYLKSCIDLSLCPDSRRQLEISPIVKRSTFLARKFEEETVDEQVRLLDEIHRTMYRFLSAPIKWGEFCPHFMRAERPVEWSDDFLSLAVMDSLNLYLTLKLGKGNSVLSKKKGKPYLDYALRVPGHLLLDQWNLKTIEILLEHGGDPNARFNSGTKEYQSKSGITRDKIYDPRESTPWAAVLYQVWKCIHTPENDNPLHTHPTPSRLSTLFELLLSHHADPHACITVGSKELMASVIIDEALAESPEDAARIKKLLLEKKNEKNGGGTMRSVISHFKGRIGVLK